ncbi:rRNA-processing protein fcf2 [Ceratocystis fimbriata CBS 114723]|uniref:rRNA-processing protein fcf2 n=1 Tax=Ceratocystis fimbriata CBS 114723 TaxID=1035309 RepID=A0A2C5W357_9PEZI|nr:rRNA-processing protein fcf2 [Ceratocystis fimbriata CBS 114723]
MTELTTQLDVDGLLAAAEARLANSATSTKLPVVLPMVNNAIANRKETKAQELEVRQVESAAKSVSEPYSNEILVPNTNIVAVTKTEKKDTAGSGWFDLPKTNLTPELKRDLQLLRLRNALNPKVHYKKQSWRSQVPRYSHVGEVIAGPTDFFSSRITKKERRNTFAQEVLAVEKSTGKFKAKYGEIQKVKTSGRKAFAKARRNALKSK